MQTKKKQISEFKLAKEMFIPHILSDIQDYYQLKEQCLGQGGFGRVLEGIKKKFTLKPQSHEIMSHSLSSLQTRSQSEKDQQYFQEPRAIKAIRYKRFQDKQLMINQIEILSYLDHPLIIKLYETYEHKKNLYLILEKLNGGDLLTAIINQNRFSESNARIVFKQLIKALKYLHCQQICHRDLKPENILFVSKEDLKIKLIDFGLAFCWEQDMRKQLKNKGLHKKLTGTAEYMSPEMLSQNYDQKCDIWSAGVILYILLSGLPPFQGETEKQIKQNIKNYNFTLDTPQFSDVSKNAQDLIQNIFKPQNQRFTLNQILAHPWMLASDLQNATETESDQKFAIKSVKITANNQMKQKTVLNQSSNSSCGPCQTLHKHQKSIIKRQNSQSGSSNTFPQAEKLNIQKLQYYSELSMLQKFHATYAVSKLSQASTKRYGQQFLNMDRDNDGSISKQQLEKYLTQTSGPLSRQAISKYFNELNLSKRGSVSYSQYLACILAYHHKKLKAESFLLDKKCQGQDKISTDQNIFLDSIDLFDDFFLHKLFFLLDKNRDGLISIKDFTYLLKENGIQKQNHGFIIYLTSKFKELFDMTQKDLESVQQIESEGPMKQKERLIRTYKSESDGGTCIGFKTFQHLIIGSELLSK